MAESKKTNKSSSSSSSKSGIWGLNKISFLTIVAGTVLYALNLVFSAIGGKLTTVVGILSGIATAIMICIVAVLAWRYVRNKPIVWKVLYIICLLIVIAGIIVPLVI